MAESASTGRGGARRDLLKAVAVLPALLLARRSAAADYASAAEALAAIESVALEVDDLLRLLEAGAPGARKFAASLRRDLLRHQAERAALRQRLGLGAAARGGKTGVGDGPDLEALRASAEKLAYALAESLPALGDAAAVRVIAHHMVDASRHLTLVNLWIEAEERRG